MAEARRGGAGWVSPQRVGKAGGGVGAHDRPPLKAPEPWELELLRLLSEQGAVPFDQLARFLDADQRQAASIARHLTRVGYADYGRTLYDEPHWVWPTRRGARFSGTGFVAEPPKVGAMARMRAVNEIRLQIARRAPDARWVCSRGLTRELGTRGYRLNGVVEVDGERHAILLSFNPAPPERLLAILATHMRRYDALIAFCSPRSLSQVKRLAAKHHWPKLVIRPIPQAAQPHG